MSGWDVDYNQNTAERIYDDVREGKHLKGFSIAKTKLDGLKRALESIKSEAEWWRDQCKQAAEHYKALREDVKDYPDGVSEQHEQEAFSKSPQVLFDYAAALQEGAYKVSDLIHSVDEMIKKLEYAEDSAKEESGKVLEKISEAIDLMNEYLRVRF